jgi:hypothetical protein
MSEIFGGLPRATLTCPGSRRLPDATFGSDTPARCIAAVKSPDVITYIYSAEWLLEIEAIAVV